jgi:hypothetical protein
LGAKNALGELASTGESGVTTSSIDFGKQASEKSGIVHAVTFVFKLRSDLSDIIEFVLSSVLASALDSALDSAVEFLPLFSSCLTPFGTLL